MDGNAGVYFPIIYVRGYAMTSAEIADAVSSPLHGLQRRRNGCAGLGQPGAPP